MTAAPPSRRRNVLVGILGILACIAVTLSATTLWVHQVALDTDRYVEVVRRVAADPEVVAEVSAGLAERVVDRFEIPRIVKPLLQDWIEEQVARFMASDAFLDGWARANRAAHTILVQILRSESVLPDEPVTISIGQLLVIVIERLQEVGVIPEDVELPDRSDSAAVERIRSLLMERLDVDLPEDFGQITIVRPARLEAARQFVRIFDVVAVASAILAAVLLALTIWLARDRLRAVILMGIGVATALLAAIGATAAISGFVANALAEAGARGTLGALLDAMLGNLVTALAVVLILGVVVAAAALIIGRYGVPPAMWFAPAEAAPLPSVPASEPPPKAPAKPRATASPKPPAKPRAKASPKPPAKPRAKSPEKPPPTTPS
ncbi:MAG TPA: hypothetical protein VFP83_08550 [Candidatus Limnocylindria bacterium]|nr:hypothetical protein [Candidatus Limnocylindria bacterium]